MALVMSRAVLLIFALPAPALAQEPEEQLIVTGRGLGQGAGDAAYDTVLLPRDRLTGSASGRLDEILKDVPGFQLFRRSDARSANPTSQGVTLRALGGNASSRALLILDGVPQADPFGGWVNWPAYDPERLGQVRVVRGGGSGVAGPGALAGTIELSSADPSETAGVQAALAYGSRDSLDARAIVGTELGSGFVRVGANYGSGDGFVPIVAARRGPVDRPSPYQQGSLALRLVAPVMADVELQASGLLFSDERERGTAFSDNDTKGADASLRLVGRQWEALAYLQTRDYRNSFASVNAARTAATQVSEQYSVPSTGLGARAEWRPTYGPLELRLGADWRRTEGETREVYQFVDGAGTRAREAGGQTDTIGGFAEAALETMRFTLTAGGRIDRWRISNGFLDERVIASGTPLTQAEFRDRSAFETSFRAGLSWRAAGAVKVRGAAYLGWRLPTLNELYRPFRVGPDAVAANAELKPERLRGIEAGIEYRPLPTARIGATMFANRLEDGIANVTLGRGPGTFPGVGFVAGEYRQRRNLDAIEVIGIELDGNLQLGRLTLSGGYSLADAKVRAGGAAAPLNGLRPAQTPRHTLAGTVAWRSAEGMRASATVRYVSGQFEDDLNQDLLPGALTFDAAAELPITERLSIDVRAENLTDKLVVAALSGDDLVERATPRTIWVGFRLRQ